MNIDQIIAGPDPVTDREVLDANNAEAEDTYAKVMARVAGRKVTNPRVRRRVKVVSRHSDPKPVQF